MELPKGADMKPPKDSTILMEAHLVHHRSLIEERDNDLIPLQNRYFYEKGGNTMQKESIVLSVGCLFISLLLILPTTSLADDKNEANYEELKSKCDGHKTDCEKLLEFKPKLNDLGTLLFKDLNLKGLFGFTNISGTSGILEQFSLPAEIKRTQKYGIGIAYKDKPLVSSLMAFIQKPQKYTPLQDLVLDPIKLNAEVFLGRVLETKNGLITDKFTVQTSYNAEISYCLPIETLMYHFGKSTGITWFKDKNGDKN